MPNIKKTERRPWMLPPKKAQSGRLFESTFYQTPAWRKVRKAFIAANPLCEECQKLERTIEATVVDHIQQINPWNAFDTCGGEFGLALSFSNLQSLCSFHHNQKSGRERHEKAL